MRIIKEATSYEFDVNGEKWIGKISPNKDHYGDRKEWDLIVKLPNGEVRKYESVFWYKPGYSQGQNRGMEYFLNILGYGESSNGSGVASQKTPFLGYRDKNWIEDILSGNGTKNNLDLFDKAMTIEKKASK